ncbi:MAG: hypothetical protein EOM53_03220 [Alphaproteobacteria bacterium]|nr:hypothetical protein [Alphaproteobacteria bacterium]
MIQKSIQIKPRGNGLEQEFDELREPEDETLEEVLSSIKKVLSHKTGVGDGKPFSLPLPHKSSNYSFSEDEIFELTEQMRMSPAVSSKLEEGKIPTGEELFELIKPSLKEWLKEEYFSPKRK